MLKFLITIITFLIIHPFLQMHNLDLYATQVGLSLILCMGISAISKDKKLLTISAIMAIIISLLGVVNLINPDIFYLQILHLILTAIIFFHTITVILSNILQSKKVKSKTLYAACSAYLLLGIFSGLISVITEVFDPNSFALNVNETGFSKLIYFGFVCFTSLGFGDIVPLTPVSEMLTIIIASTGQLYSTLIVAIIVGKYLKEH